jgi:hypothetical protein
MPGKRITDQQYRLYMKTRKLGQTQAISAAKAGISERSGRALEKQGHLPSQRQNKRGRKAGLHMFSEIWESEIVPLLQKTPPLSAVVIFEHLQDLYPERYAARNLRTLQRLVRHWRTVYGCDREVIFRQVHPPGLQGLSDFTSPKTFGVTIKGQVFEHIFYHFRLAYSCWSHLKVIEGGESFSALSSGLQDALSRLGGCPQEHRTDSLSAGYKNLSTSVQEDLTRRYEDLCRHYNLLPTRNNLGQGHENGSVESAHGHLKRRIEQALVLRGSYDFETKEAYQQFIDVVVERHNKRHQKQIDEERLYLQPLPVHRALDCDLLTVRVTTSSTIYVKNVVYSVPSRLIGQQIRIHLYSHRLVGYLGPDQLFELPRQKSLPGKRQYCIDYRHVIQSLALKPQAFRYSVLKDALLPNATYKEIWHLLNQGCVSRHACKLMVGLLKIACDYNCEADLGDKVLSLLQKGEIPSLGSLQRRYETQGKNPTSYPDIVVPKQNIAAYNQLLPSCHQEDCYA